MLSDYRAKGRPGQERGEELSDFVSTSKGVLQSLVEKHFPAPDRGKITKILGIGGKQITILGKTENILNSFCTKKVLKYSF